MRNKTLKITIVLFMLLALAFTVNAETIHLTYKRPADDMIILENTTSTSVNLTLPKTILELDIENENRTFKARIPTLSIANISEVNLTVRDLDALDVYNTSLDLGHDKRYRPRLVHAFAIENEEQINDTYTVYLDYSSSGAIGGYDIVVYKFNYNFTSNETDYDNYQKYTTSTGLTVDTTNKIAYFQTENFSNFVLTEDTYTAAPSGSPSGPGGSGGSGGIRGVSMITVTPTHEGQTITAPVNTLFNVIYDAKTYPVEFIYANGFYVKLKNMITGDYWTFLTELPQKVNFDQTGSDDIEITLLALDKNEGIFLFRLLGGAPYRPSIPYSDIGSRPYSEIKDEPTPTTTPPPSTPSGAAIAPPVTQQPLPESPISLWTILLSLLFIIVLVGGIAVYRRHLSMDKPPAAIRTGLGRPLSETKLPPTTSEKLKPVPTLTSTPSRPEEPLPFERTEEKISEEEVTETFAAESVEEKPAIPVQQVMMVEKYIYHALSQGYTEAQIRPVLQKKGWNQDIIDKLFKHIEYTDEHIESHDLHTHTDADQAMTPVKRLLEKGFDEEHIRHGLRRKGWTDAQIDDLFSRI